MDESIGQESLPSFQALDVDGEAWRASGWDEDVPCGGAPAQPTASECTARTPSTPLSGNRESIAAPGGNEMPVPAAVRLGSDRATVSAKPSNPAPAPAASIFRLAPPPAPARSVGSVTEAVVVIDQPEGDGKGGEGKEKAEKAEDATVVDKKDAMKGVAVFADPDEDAEESLLGVSTGGNPAVALAANPDVEWGRRFDDGIDSASEDGDGDECKRWEPHQDTADDPGHPLQMEPPPAAKPETPGRAEPAAACDRVPGGCGLSKLEVFFRDPGRWQQVVDELEQNGELKVSTELLRSLAPPRQRFRVVVPQPFPGIQYRKSKNLKDRYNRFAKHGSVVSGLVENDQTWLRISDVTFLPMTVNGHKVLEPHSGPPSDEEGTQASPPLPRNESGDGDIDTTLHLEAPCVPDEGRNNSPAILHKRCFVGLRPNVSHEDPFKKDNPSAPSTPEPFRKDAKTKGDDWTEAVDLLLSKPVNPLGEEDEKAVARWRGGSDARHGAGRSCTAKEAARRYTASLVARCLLGRAKT